MTLEEIEERYADDIAMLNKDREYLLGVSEHRGSWQKIADIEWLISEVKRLRAAIEKHRGDMMWSHFHRNQELYKALGEDEER